jgi:WD40 repeat protein
VCLCVSLSTGAGFGVVPDGQHTRGGAGGGRLRAFSFRSDGKVLAAGGESKVVQVFDVQHKTLLRQLSGHAAAVRAVRGPSTIWHNTDRYSPFETRLRRRCWTKLRLQRFLPPGVSHQAAKGTNSALL